MVGVLMVAIVITSTGATFGVLMTLFSFANCLGDIVLCIIPFFLRKKYPHACRHAGFTMPLWVLYVSYPVGSVAMVLGYLRITPGKVKALWTNTVEKTEFEKINEGEIE